MSQQDVSRTWSPSLWREFTAVQQPDYPQTAAVREAETQLRLLPLLVTGAEIRRLREALIQVSRGEGVILQCGDCAESFTHCREDVLRSWADTVTRMAEFVRSGLSLPVLKIGRIAGQYAKPRSSPEEVRNGVSLPSYRGDIINGHAFDAVSRKPDPGRMQDAYYRAAVSLNTLRSTPAAEDPVEFRPFYVSHEALLLPYESALTRQDPADGKWYNGAGHTLWLGDRTSDPSQAHVQYLRGIENPVGIKCGPSMTPAKLRRLLARLNPYNQPGKIMLIIRMGTAHIADKLPPLIAKVAADRDAVIWLSDPMHGNTRSTAEGLKTRDFPVVYQEAHQCIALLREAGMHAGGLHLEMTGRPVTECTGGPQKITDAEVGLCYESLCDPRLNGAQATELVRLLAGSENR